MKNSKPCYKRLCPPSQCKTRMGSQPCSASPLYIYSPAVLSTKSKKKWKMPRTPLPLSFVPCLESKSENNKQCKTQSSKMAFKRRQAKAVYQRRSAPSQPFLPPCYSWGAISSLEKYFGQCRKEEPTPWNILSYLQKTEKSILLGGQSLRENRLCVKLLISNFN